MKSLFSILLLSSFAAGQPGSLLQHQNYPSARIHMYEYDTGYDMVLQWLGQHTDILGSMNNDLSPFFYDYTTSTCPSELNNKCLMANTYYVDTLFDIQYYYMDIEPFATNRWYDTEGMFTHQSGDGGAHLAYDYHWTNSSVYIADAFDFSQVITPVGGLNVSNLVNAVVVGSGVAPWSDKTSCSYQGTCTGGVTIPNGQYLYVGYAMPYDTMNFTVSEAIVGGRVTASYWNGTTWATSSSKGPLILTDNTNGFTVTGTNKVILTPPPDWQRTTVSGTGISTLSVCDYGIAHPNTSRPMFIVRFGVTGSTIPPNITKLTGDNWASTTTNPNTLSACGGACNMRAWGGLGAHGYLISSEHFKYNPDVNQTYAATATFEYQARITGPIYTTEFQPNFQHPDQNTSQVQWIYAKLNDTVQLTKYLPPAKPGSANGVMFDNAGANPTTNGATVPAFDYNYTDVYPCSWGAGGPGNCVQQSAQTPILPSANSSAWIASMNRGGTGLYSMLKAIKGSSFIISCNAVWMSVPTWQTCDVIQKEGVFTEPGYARDWLRAAYYYNYFDIPRDNANPNSGVFVYDSSDVYISHGITGYGGANYFPLGMGNRSPMYLLTAQYIMSAPPASGTGWRYSIGSLVNAMSDSYGTLDKSHYTTTTTPIYPTQFSISSTDPARGGNTVYYGTFPGGDVSSCWGRSPTYVVTVSGYPTALTNPLHVNNGIFTCVSTTATSMVLSNAAGMASTQVATAVFPFTSFTTAPLNSVGVVNSANLLSGQFQVLRDGPQNCTGYCRSVRLCPAGSDYWNGDNSCYDKGEFLFVNVISGDKAHVNLTASNHQSGYVINNYYPPGSVIENFVHGSVSNNWDTTTDTFTGDDWRNILYWSTYFPAMFYDLGIPDTSPLSAGTSWQGVGTTVPGTAASRSCARPLNAACQPGDRDMAYRTGAQSSYLTDCTTHNCTPTMTRHYMRQDGKQVVFLWRPGSAGDWVSEAFNLGRPIDLQSGPISSGGENMNGPFQELFADGRLGTPLNSCVTDGLTCGVGSGIPIGHQIIRLRAVDSVVLIQE